MKNVKTILLVIIASAMATASSAQVVKGKLRKWMAYDSKDVPTWFTPGTKLVYQVTKEGKSVLFVAQLEAIDSSVVVNYTAYGVGEVTGTYNMTLPTLDTAKAFNFYFGERDTTLQRETSMFISKILLEKMKIKGYSPMIWYGFLTMGEFSNYQDDIEPLMDGKKMDDIPQVQVSSRNHNLKMVVMDVEAFPLIMSMDGPFSAKLVEIVKPGGTLSGTYSSK